MKSVESISQDQNKEISKTQRIEGIADAYEVVARGICDGLKPPPPPDFIAWAQENVIFGTDDPFPGPYNPQKFPFFDDILKTLQPDHPARMVTLMKSAQLGGTILAQVFTGATMDRDPCGFLYVHPTIENGGRWVKTKWKKFVRGSTALTRVFPSDKISRDTSNSTLFKETYNGRGWLQVSGANSEASLSMMTAKKQVQDDLAKWENNNAGDPESQADSRSQAYEFDAKIFKISTPMIKGACRITKAYHRSDMRVFEVPCPHCGHEHALTWDNFKQSITQDMDPASAHFTCPECGGVIEHHHKEDIVARGKWVATQTDKDRPPGFYIWSAYSPLISWARIAQKFLDADGDPQAEQTFMNDVAGLPYEQKGEAPPWEELSQRGRSGDYHAGIIPQGYPLLTIGVDVQGDRVEWLLKAFGPNLTRYTIQHGVIDGHISEARTRQSLDKLLQRKWRNVFGQELEADMMAIDMNYETNDVIDWAKRWPEKRVICVRGMNKTQAPPIALVKKDRDTKGKVIARQKRYWNVGVFGLKASLYKHLEKDDPLDRGYCGFPNDLDDDYYRQLCSERRILKTRKDGFTEMSWVKLPDVRNEVLDMELYAEAAARRLSWHNASDDQWRALMAVREKEVPDMQYDMLEPNVMPPEAKEQNVKTEESENDDGRDGDDVPPDPPSRPRRRIRSKGIQNV